MCDKFKKVLKIVAVIAAVAGFAVAVYALIKKFCPKCKNDVIDEDKCDYVSCSCFEDKEEEVTAE